MGGRGGSRGDCLACKTQNVFAQARRPHTQPRVMEGMAEACRLRVSGCSINTGHACCAACVHMWSDCPSSPVSSMALPAQHNAGPGTHTPAHIDSTLQPTSSKLMVQARMRDVQLACATYPCGSMSVTVASSGLRIHDLRESAASPAPSSSSLHPPPSVFQDLAPASMGQVGANPTPSPDAQPLPWTAAPTPARLSASLRACCRQAGCAALRAGSVGGLRGAWQAVEQLVQLV